MKPHPSIPSDAKLVFSGIRSEIYQWKQMLYDGTETTFERIRFVDGAFVLPVLKNGKILLTRQEQPSRDPFISLPGGGLETSDISPEECAKRELFEETGATSDDWTHWMTFLGTPHAATFIDYYIARNVEIVTDICPDGGEKISLFEVTFDEFLELASNNAFSHHWNLLPIMYEARLHKDKYQTLKEKIFKK